MTKYYLALDPSKASTGWAILAWEEDTVKYVDGGFIDTRRKENWLRVIRQELSHIVGLYPIEKVVPKEQMFYRHNIASMVLAKVHGVIEEFLGDYDVRDIPSATVRKMIGGHRNADKNMVADGVRRLLHLPPDFDFPRSDVSDSVSIGLTYLIKNNLLPLTA